MRYTYGIKRYKAPARVLKDQYIAVMLIAAVLAIGVAATPKHYSDAAYIKSLGIKRFWKATDPEVAAYLESQAEYEDWSGSVTGANNAK